MKTILRTTIALVFAIHSDATTPKKRGLYSLTTDFGLGSPSWSSSGLDVPLQTYSTSGVENFLPFATGSHSSINLGQNVNISPDLGPHANISPVPVLSSNSIEKPVQEQTQEFAPPQMSGAAIIPYQPPPAVPVSAAAANVPSNTGAVFLGSGSLGVVNLGGGAYALGSGGIGYSDIRRQPRPSGTSPLYPPLQATPNLVPAATPSQTQPAQLPAYYSSQPSFQYNPFGQQSLGNQNGYAPAGNTGFGEEPLRFRLPKTTTSYATATIQQIQQQVIQPGQQAMPGFGEPIPQIIDLSQQLPQQLSSQQIQAGTTAQQQAQLRQQQAQLQQQINQQVQLQQQQQQQAQFQQQRAHL